MTTTITKLRHLRGVGIFSDYSHGVGTPVFRRYNLVYGFNGCGKTTLSRVFQSIGAGKLSSKLPPQGELTVELSDGTIIKSDNLKSAVSSRILVFNHDFISENLIWDSGEAKPVFYIGTAQGNSLKLLKVLEGRTGPRNQARTDAEKDARTKERDFSTFKTDIGKLIAQELNLGRQYNATNVEGDYQVFSADAARELSEDERKARKALINRVAPAQDIIFNRPPRFAAAQTIREALDIYSRSLGGMLIDALRQHPSMTGWVKAGMDYHVEHSLTDCLHCGQGLTAERILALQASFDASYDDHVRLIEATRSKVIGHMESLRAISEALPTGEFPADLLEKYNSSRAALRDAGRRCHAILRAIRLGLEEKAKAPNLAVSVELPETAQVIETLDEAINEAIGTIAGLVEAHNAQNSRFAAEQKKASLELKAHHLREGYARYLELREALRAAKHERDIRQGLADRHENRVVAVRDKLRSHGPPIDTINKLLKSFLGHGELTLATDGEGYRIQRRAKAATGPLSEGEKTAIAFCYYLTKLEEDGRKKQDVIAIVDDPISSLDTNALNYAFNLLKRSLADASQLVVLTHNMDFMNETKKWLKGKAYPHEEGKKPDAALFFIATAVSPCGTIRSATIGELPKLLRQFDSEYQYLFSLVYLFREGRADEFAYLMPNVMRKVLELFLAFKFPAPGEFTTKLDHRVVRDCGIDLASLAALARLSNLESHSSLDDLVTLPSMTVQESRTAAGCLFELMELLDGEHFKGMTTMSRKANPAPSAAAAA